MYNVCVVCTRCVCKQAGIDTFMHRISGLEGDRAALEEQLKRTHHMVTCLQVGGAVGQLLLLLRAVSASPLCLLNEGCREG